MTLPSDPVHLSIALFAIAAVAILIVRVAQLLFGLYLFGIGALYLRGHRLASTLVMIVGGLLIGGLGVLTYHGVMGLLGWLL